MAAEDYHEDFYENAFSCDSTHSFRPRPRKKEEKRLNPFRQLKDMEIVNTALESLSTAGGEDCSDSEKIDHARACLSELLRRGSVRKAQAEKDVPR